MQTFGSSNENYTKFTIPALTDIVAKPRLQPIPGTQRIVIPYTPRFPAAGAAIGAICFDTETHLTENGIQAPKMVCLSYVNGTHAGLLRGDDALDFFLREIINAPEIIGQNIAYDMAVMAQYSRMRGFDALPLIFKAYSENRVFDIGIAEQEHAIGRGHLGTCPDGSPMRDPETNEQCKYRLSWLAFHHLKVLAKENDEWRLRYGELDPLPFENWPTNALQYPIDDAINTFEVRKSQHLNAYMNQHDVAPRSGKAWVLHLGAVHGRRVVDKYINELEDKTREIRDNGFQQFQELGFFKTKGGKQTRNQATIKRHIVHAYDTAGAATPCEHCGGDGLRSPVVLKSGKLSQAARANCPECEGTGLDISKLKQVPRTEGDGISISRDSLEESDNPTLMAFAKVIGTDKTFSTYIPYLRRWRNKKSKRGEETPYEKTLPRSPVINMRPEPLLVTGRVSYSDPSQTFPREGDERACFEAREGWAQYSVDYAGVELVTHGQNVIWILGTSELANVLNRGGKPHDMLAAKFAGISDSAYALRKTEARMMAYRQAAKPVNFGLPGGMGELTLVLQQRASGPDTPCPNGPTWVTDQDTGLEVRGYKGLRFCILMNGATSCGAKKIQTYKRKESPPVCEACVLAARDAREAWLLQWPENKPYFKWVQEQVENHGAIRQHVSKRIRGQIAFTEAANSMFQEIAAEATLRAMFEIARQQYTCPDSPLYGSRGTLMAHDELIGEAPLERAHEVVTAVRFEMEKSLKAVCPDMARAASAEETLMIRWYKQAKLVRDANGRVIPWHPKKKSN